MQQCCRSGQHLAALNNSSFLLSIAAQPLVAFKPVVACACLPASQVYLNGTRLPVKTFQEYVEQYLGPKDNGVPRIYERVNDRWEICISTTEGQFQQVSRAL